MQGKLQLGSDTALGCVDRKWIVLGGREGSGQSCALQIYYANNKYGVNLFNIPYICTLVCKECKWEVKREKTTTGQVAMMASVGK